VEVEEEHMPMHKLLMVDLVVVEVDSLAQTLEDQGRLVDHQQTLNHIDKDILAEQLNLDIHNHFLVVAVVVLVVLVQLLKIIQ
tara:strand:+ start:69 stop:317 length:249 start_codon:yes stop_codon:yes gene_type:complete